MKKIAITFFILFFSYLQTYADIIFPEDIGEKKDFTLYYILLGVLALILLGSLIYLKKSKKHDR